MRGAVLYGPGDVRFEERAAPAILKPTDAIIRIAATSRGTAAMLWISQAPSFLLPNIGFRILKTRLADYRYFSVVQAGASKLGRNFL
jgi:hypothetical protein